MDHSEYTSRKRGGGFAVVLVVLMFAAPVLYVLSVGPAIRLHRTCGQPTREAIETIYRPVEWLLSTPLEEPLQWYIELWEP